MAAVLAQLPARRWYVAELGPGSSSHALKALIANSPSAAAFTIVSALDPYAAVSKAKIDAKEVDLVTRVIWRAADLPLITARDLVLAGVL